MKSFKYVLFAAMLVLPGIASAAIVYPALDIQDFAGDTGLSVTATTLGIDSTAFVIITSPGNFIDIPDQPFTLTGTGSYSGGFGTFSGSFTVGGGLLTGTFTNLQIGDLGTSLSFNADLTYTGGSLAGALGTGRLEGGSDAGGHVSKIGPVVVPVPAAVWLFGSGLLGLAGIARRKSLA